MSADTRDNNYQKTVLITGASRRLGLFLCEHFLENGWKVVALTRRASAELSELAVSGSLTFFELGEYAPARIDAAAKAVRAKLSRLDALVHNTSVFEKDDADGSYKHDAYMALFSVHMAVPAQLNFALAPLLNNVEQPGNIVHITDIYAENPNKDYVLYCSTKAALENLSKGFAKKFAPGVRVNTIQPGPIQFLPNHSDTLKEQVLAETLLAKEGGFLPVFQAIESILENSYMTGASIKVDGGRALGRP